MNLCAKTAVALVLLAAGTAHADPGFAPVATITGVASVRDGDGILFGDVEIRLQGVAAPEFGSHAKDPGGLEALRALERLATGREVRCELDGSTARRRPVGVCFVDGEDLGAALVRAGFARDCPAFSRGRYSDEEAAARRAGHDLSSIYDLPGYCR